MSIYKVLYSKSECDTENVNWLELDRSPHAIRFYSGDDFLLDSLSRFVSTVLEVRDTCVVIATEAHLNSLAEHLKSPGVETNRAVKRRRYALENTRN